MGRLAPLRFALQAAILVAVGVALAAAGLELLPFVGAMAVAWVLVAAAERLLWRPRVAATPVGWQPLDEESAPRPVHRSRPPEPVAPERRGPGPQPALVAVPGPEPEPEPEPAEEGPEEPVPELPQAAHRRPDGWNLWDLEQRAKERAGEDQLRDEEWHALFVSLREFAHPDGTLPSEFDGLVQDSFAALISRRA